MLHFNANKITSTDALKGNSSLRNGLQDAFDTRVVTSSGFPNDCKWRYLHGKTMEEPKVSAHPAGKHTSKLQRLLVATYGFDDHQLPDLLFSMWEADRCNVWLCPLLSLQGTKDGQVSEAPMQKLAFSFIDPNLWQLSERKDEDENGEILVQVKSDLYAFDCSGPDSAGSPENVVQRESERLGRPASLIRHVPRSLANDTIPCRQKGHETEPGEPDDAAGVLFVQQR